jgi:hypothetical protein
MKRLLFFIVAVCAVLIVKGQEISVNLQAPGMLAQRMAGTEVVEKISLSGTMGDADFAVLRRLKNLTAVDLRKVKNRQLGDSLFFGMTNLKNVRLPKKLKRMGTSTFEGCTALEFVEFPSGMSEIPDFTFKDCTKLDKLDVFNSNVDRIGKGAFMNSGIRIIPLPKELRSIDMMAFMNCQRMEQIRIPRWVLEIGALAFANCTSLRDILVRTETPPTCAQDAFTGLDKCTLHVMHPEFYRDRVPWNKIDLDFRAYNGQELKTFDRSDIFIRDK